MSKVWDHLKGELKIGMDSYKCKVPRKNHPNCKGCESLDSCIEYLSRVKDYMQVKFGYDPARAMEEIPTEEMK